MFTIASGNSRGSAALERVTSGALLTVALALFAVCGMVLQGVSRVQDRGRDR